jgi:hypothetical protein
MNFPKPSTEYLDALYSSDTAIHNRPAARMHSRLDPSLILRCATVLAALAILFWRMPTSFTNPQFWAEDIHFFYFARIDGWASVVNAAPGYLTVTQFLVGVFASYFDPLAAPAIYNYTAIFLTLIVCWLVTSPRLDLPCKPLLAVAVVIVPMGYEELGTLCNIQWILPIGAFAIIFMRASVSKAILTGEAFFTAMASLSGPFSIFLAPLFVSQLYTTGRGPNRSRLYLLTTIISPGAITQLVLVMLKSSPPGSSDAAYPWTLWITLPFKQIMTTFPGISQFSQGASGAMIGVCCFLAAGILACLPPYRTQKLFMLIFSGVVAVAGMVKFRDSLATQLTAQRYFYAGAVFSLWFICCIARRRTHYGLAVLVLAIEVSLLPAIRNTPRITDNLEWPVWASFIPSGLHMMIPTFPLGWSLGLPAAPDGPLARFAPWVGRNLAGFTIPDDQGCHGTIQSVQPLIGLPIPHTEVNEPPDPSMKAWFAKGTATNSTDEPVDVVALTNNDGLILGFGFPGFDAPTGLLHSGWRSIFYSRPGNVMAYNISGGRRACLLTGEISFPLNDQKLSSGHIVAGVPIVPGKDITQRFSPSNRLYGVSVTMVTWAARPSDYTVSWIVIAMKDGRRVELGAGKLDANSITDWQTVPLPISIFPTEVPDQIEVSFRAMATGDVVNPVGVATYQPGTANDSLAEIAGSQITPAQQVGLTLSYSR